MAHMNKHFLELKDDYLFAKVAQKANAFAEAHPERPLIRMGIGDVTSPLPAAVVDALKQAADEMGVRETFKGYGPYEGYDFLRELIVEHDFAPRGVQLAADEIFVADGAKNDMGNFLDLFGSGNLIGVPDPVYPAYVDANIINGNGAGIRYMPCPESNGFKPVVPQEKLDIVYLCSPNNPTGTAMTYDELQAWVEYAQKNDTLILFDAAYEAYISDADVPHSIFEIAGAKQVAAEFRSYSKTAGFTGMRCGFCVIPHELMVEGQSLNKLWLRRQSTKYNGNSYPIQKATAAIYTPAGKQQVRALVDGYMQNAAFIREGFEAMGYTVYGGKNAPYIWLKTPNGMTSWEFFDALLERCAVVGTPGSGFGTLGEGFFRFSAFGTLEASKQALARIQADLKL